MKRSLVLTPREALTDQLYRYIRRDFWSTLGFNLATGHAAFHDDGSATGQPVPEAYITKLLPSSVGLILHAAQTHQHLVLVGTLQALDHNSTHGSKACSADHCHISSHRHARLDPEL